MKQKEKLNVEVLSIAIRQAVEDLISCERSSRYVIVMSTYHNPWGDSCEVCFAGAVIARRTGTSHKTSKHPRHFPREHKMLLALDYTRCGTLHGALHILKVDERKIEELSSLGAASPHASWLRHHHYGTNPRQFKRHLLALADELEERGL